MKRWIALLLVLLLLAVLPVTAAADTPDETETFTLSVYYDEERGHIVPGDVISAAYGETVSLFFMPDEGYEVGVVIVDGYPVSMVLPMYRHCQTCEGCEECDWIDWNRLYDGVENDEWGDWKNKVIFRNIHQNHMIYVEFVPVEKAQETEEKSALLETYTDLDAEAWYAEAVEFALEQKLMDGMGGGVFAPNGTITRAQLVTMLWRLEDCPNIDMEGTAFADVEKDTWYTPAVEWAADMQIVTGHNGLFHPDDPITREQLAAILWRYAKQTGLDVSVGENTNILSYNDAFDISSYAYEPLQWACGAGVMNGSGGNLMPQGQATRAQAAAMLYRLEQLIAETVNS